MADVGEVSPGVRLRVVVAEDDLLTREGVCRRAEPGRGRAGLAHFAASLERAGFSAGADSYRQMADVVLSQWLWVAAERMREFEPRYLRIAGLAAAVADQLSPYVETMRRLTSLRGLVEERWGVDPHSPAGQVVGALATARRPMSLSEVREATGATTSVARRALLDLIERGHVTRIGDRRPKYALEAVR